MTAAPDPMSDAALRERAARVIPGGLWGHMRSQGLPAGYPQFFQRAEGCRLWDADGREYIDYVGSWGPAILGHAHPETTARYTHLTEVTAAQARERQGRLLESFVLRWRDAA